MLRKFHPFVSVKRRADQQQGILTSWCAEGARGVPTGLAGPQSQNNARATFAVCSPRQAAVLWWEKGITFYQQRPAACVDRKATFLYGRARDREEAPNTKKTLIHS